jgi:guanylate kinase
MESMLKTKKQGLLVVLSGPSGCGKNTIINKVMENNKNIWLSISCTSRAPRGEEKNGVNYYFLSRDEFEQEIANDEFLEYAEYSKNYYGTPKKYIKEHLDKGEDVILEIEIQGALKVKEKIKEAVFIFILPPSMQELKRRLEARKTEDQEKIDMRFKRAYEEINEVSKYNYVVVNDEVDQAASKVQAILDAERCRVDRIEEVYLNTEEERLHEKLLEDKTKKTQQTYIYLYHYLQSMETTEELRYILAYMSKSMGFTDPLKFDFDQSKQFIFESIMFSAMTLYHNGGSSKSKIAEVHKRFVQDIEQKNEEKLSRTQELNAAKVQALRELGYNSISEENAKEVLEKIAEIQSRKV